MGAALLFAIATGGLQASCDTAVTQPDINACALAALSRADAELNRQWQVTLAAARRGEAGDVLGADGRTAADRLLAAQRAWLAFRDAHCDSVAYGEMGAQLDYTMNIHCRAELTRQRTAQLVEIAREP